LIETDCSSLIYAEARIFIFSV